MIKLNGTINIEPKQFPDGTLLLKFDKEQFDPRSTISYEWNYESDAELFTLICLRKHLAKYPYHQLILPYIPNARQDRVKSNEDVFTLKYFCEMINSLNFNEVIVLDAHSNVSLALLDNVVQIDVMDYIDEAIQDIYSHNGGANASPLVTFFPDEGAMKRYADTVGLRYAFGIKRRNWETGKIEGLDIQNKEAVVGKDVLIIDDICSYGGTFYHSAKALKEAGAANIYLYVSHLEESVFKGDLWKAINEEGLISKIYTANPLFKYEDPVSIYIEKV
jgi:ribose-phosphate pyrophosphokinase